MDKKEENELKTLEECDEKVGNNYSDIEEEDIENLVLELQSNKDIENSVNEEDDKESVIVDEKYLKTDPLVGLNETEVLKRRKKFGFNEMKYEQQNIIIKLLKFFVGPIQFVMEAAAILAAGLQDWIDLGVICFLLVLNALVGFVQEYQAGSIVDELKKTLANTSFVVRSGELVEILSSELVPGDIVQLEDGSIVPADGTLISELCSLQIDQSAITGESFAIDKKQNDLVYSASTVKTGQAFMIVTATGFNTFVGKAAKLVSSLSSNSGHFTDVLNGIGISLLVFVVFTLLIVWVVCFYRSVSIVQILRYTLAITVIGVPVGLPAVVTTTMAVGAAYLAKKKAIVQKLSAIESLAGVEILCSDKTGTLTKNQLSLHEPYTVKGVEPDDLMLTACLAASRKKKGLDAIDKAFLKALINYPKARAALTKFKILEFTPFDPVSKKVTAIVESPDGEKIICVKGAPLFVLKTVGDDHPISEEIYDNYQNVVADFALRGFRSLGVARKRGEGYWEILGIVPCMDLPRDDTAATIHEARRLGLRIKMLTGDAVGIAKETCRQLGLGTNIYDADRLGLSGGGDMSGSEIADFVENADGFAEVFPQHKYNAVEILQSRGYLVAMTGDGVNDAPSLKKADTGIAVEGSSDAARSAADIVFLEPGLSAIIDALKTSRQIFHRMYSYVVYRIALSLHLEIFFGLWIAFLNQSLNINLVVFIAIFADVATLAIAYDNAPYERKPVKWNTPRLWGMSIVLGILLAVGSCIMLTILRVKGGGIIERNGSVDGILFLQITLTENWLIFVTRAQGPFWSSIPSFQLFGAVFAVDILASIFSFFGIFADQRTDILSIVKTWAYSLGVFCVLGGFYCLMSKLEFFDNLCNGRPRKVEPDRRTIEDFLFSMRRVSTQHEKSS